MSADGDWTGIAGRISDSQVLALESRAGQGPSPHPGGGLVSALGYVLVNLLVELSYSALDPRIRHREARER